MNWPNSLNLNCKPPQKSIENCKIKLRTSMEYFHGREPQVLIENIYLKKNVEKSN